MNNPDHVFLDNYTAVRVDFGGRKFYLHKGFALQEMIRAIQDGTQIVALDFNEDGLMSIEDLLQALGVFTEAASPQISGGLAITGTFSNSRQVECTAVHLHLPWNGSDLESFQLESAGFAFQWASWQDEQSVGDWGALNTFRLLIPVINSQIDSKVEIHFLRNVEA